MKEEHEKKDDLLVVRIANGDVKEQRARWEKIRNRVMVMSPEDNNVFLIYLAP